MPEQPLPDPAYMTPAEVGRELRVSAKTIYRLAAADPTMPQLHLSAGTLRFPRERLLKWLKAREGQPVTGRRPSPKLMSPAHQVLELPHARGGEEGA